MSKRWLPLLLIGIWLGRAGVANAALNLSTDPLNFPNVIATQSTTLSTTLSATNPTSVNVTVVLHGGADCSQFQIVSPTGTVHIDNNDSELITVRFAPTSRGDKTCQIDIKDGGGNILKNFDANGKGVAPVIAITSPSPADTLAFGHVDVGFTSNPALQIVAKNDGDSTLNITAASITTGTSDFLVTAGSPATTVAPTMSATWDIVCKPSAKDARTGTFHIVSDSFTNKTIDVTLTCTGDLASLVTTMTNINFGNVQRGTTQMATFMLTNSGNVPVTTVMSNFGSNSLGYAFAAPAPTTVAANSSENITVVFNPLNKTHGGPTTISFSGSWGNGRTAAPPLPISITGQEASFAVTTAPLALDFGNFRFDAHVPKTFVIVNDGNAPLAITAPFTEGTSTKPTEYKIDLAKSGTTLPQPVSINANEQLVVSVSPQVDRRIGLVEGAINVTSNSIGSVTEHIPVTGIATAANLKIPAMVDFGVVDINSPPPAQTIKIENTGNDMLDIMSLTTNEGNPAFTLKLPATPAHIAPNSSLDIPVTYMPTATTDPDAPDTTILSAELAGSLNATATITITGDAVFTSAHGSGGCDAGGGAGGGLVIMLGALALVGRRRRLAGLAITIAAATLAAAPAAHADGLGLTVFAPTPATTGAGFALQAPDVGASGSWVANAVVSYAANPLVLDTTTGAGQTHNAPVERSTLMQLGLAYALLGRFELGASMPLYQQSGEGLQAVKGTARGNLALHVKARLVRARLGAGTFVAGASATALVPTATKGQFTGSDQPEGRLLVLAGFTPAAMGSRLSLSINAGSVIRSEAVYFNVVKKTAAAWGGGASVRLLDELWATGEIYGELTPSGLRPAPMPGAAATMTTLSQVEWLAGLSIKPERRLVIGLAVGRGLTDAVGTPDLRGVLSLGFVPGAAAVVPIHPPEPPKPDGDADGDGIPDSIDKCPNEPEDKDMFEDGDGCPDPDNDHDGVPDALDKCPLDPEDRDGYQDDDGCPDKDNDGDGIPDAVDKCPNEPEDKDGFEDLDGCPDPDNDHDGIPDATDKCPNQPETINGIQDDDGCPDKGDSTIILSPDRIETLDPIQFTQLKLAKASNPVLAQVAATLRAHGEIVRLRVTVHVQPTADHDADQAKSDKRAQAVRDWLVQWGIAPARIEARGFGSTKPLVAPDQRGAPKINDRIELIILERK